MYIILPHKLNHKCTYLYAKHLSNVGKHFSNGMVSKSVVMFSFWNNSTKFDVSFKFALNVSLKLA